MINISYYLQKFSEAVTIIRKKFKQKTEKLCLDNLQLSKKFNVKVSH